MTDFIDDDDSGFWDIHRSEPTIQLNRVRKTPERTRSHRVVEQVPTAMARSARGPRVADTRRDATDRRGAMRMHGEAHDDPSGTIWVETSATGSWARIGGRRRAGFFGSVDPRLLSVGALSVAAVLAVPLFGALGDSDGPDDVLSVAPADSTIAPTTTLAPTTEAVVVSAPIDDPDDGASDAYDDSGGSSRSAGAGDAPSDEAGGMTSASASAGSGDGSGGGVLAEPAVRVAAQCGNPYEVEAGEYWIGIATKIDYPVAELLEYNEATADTPLYPGSVVCLPLGTTIAPAITDTPATTAAPAATDAPATDAPTTVDPQPAASTQPATTQPATTPPATTSPATTSPETNPPTTTRAPDDDRPTGPIPSSGEVEQIIREIWPDDLEEKALQIAWRESNYRADVTSSIGCCHGVFQIHEVHLSWLGEYGITSVGQLFDARTNVQAAYYLYQRAGGWGHWDTA